MNFTILDMAIGEHLRSNIDHHGLSDDLALGGFVSVGPEKKKVSRRKAVEYNKHSDCP